MHAGWLILNIVFAGLLQVDPEYLVPKENPYASTADLKSGQQLFMAQCARCHGRHGEGGKRGSPGTASIASRARRSISFPRDPG